MTVCCVVVGIFILIAFGDVSRFAVGCATAATLAGLMDEAWEPSVVDAGGGGGGGNVNMVRVRGFATEVRDTNCNKGDDAEVMEEEVTAGDALTEGTEIDVFEGVMVDRLDEELADVVEGAIVIFR